VSGFKTAEELISKALARLYYNRRSDGNEQGAFSIR
jgi:hypothetical protein